MVKLRKAHLTSRILISAKGMPINGLTKPTTLKFWGSGITLEGGISTAHHRFRAIKDHHSPAHWQAALLANTSEDRNCKQESIVKILHGRRSSVDCMSVGNEYVRSELMSVEIFPSLDSTTLHGVCLIPD